jgi:rfaE bifunctional protein kinase chain/domain
VSRAPASLPSARRLAELARALRGVRVTVLGDPVLDEFHTGEILRVSREAPVLILEHQGTTLAPGGAANAAVNLASVGVRVALVGRVGADDAGRRLRSLLRQARVGVRGLLTERGHATPVKSRVLAGGPHSARQQIVRIDRGTGQSSPSPALLRRMVRAATEARGRGGALLLADYDYGAATPEIAARLVGRRRGPVFLDSRFRIADYRGVAAATPNAAELETALGLRLAPEDDRGVLRAGARLRRRIGAEALLVTRGSRGMALCVAGRRGVVVPVFGSDEVADVTGAGDTVIAVFTATRSAGGSWIEAASLANVAGGLVVMKRGTATVTVEEILAALASGRPPQRES